MSAFDASIPGTTITTTDFPHSPHHPIIRDPLSALRQHDVLPARRAPQANNWHTDSLGQAAWYIDLDLERVN
jgi:hypothetical protein